MALFPFEMSVTTYTLTWLIMVEEYQFNMAVDMTNVMGANITIFGDK